ncbi:MAG: TetR/AcrR family transcriptional regulator [Bdellovibrionales bacterium]|nr:TetR/AcrR family transcriptional regulator [Bdellovibrionales bacterium]
MSVSSKKDKQLAVSNAVLDIIEREGLNGITHSKVSRKAAVSRPWIYEYIGKEKNDLIDFAANELGAYFSRVNLTELPQNISDLEKQLKDGTDFLIETTHLNPTVIKLFYRYRGTSNSLGQIIEKYESKWLKTASKTLCEIFNLAPRDAILIVEFILTVRLGYAHRIVTSFDPKDSEQQAKKTFEAIHNLLSGFLES